MRVVMRAAVRRPVKSMTGMRPTEWRVYSVGRSKQGEPRAGTSTVARAGFHNQLSRPVRSCSSPCRFGHAACQTRTTPETSIVVRPPSRDHVKGGDGRPKNGIREDDGSLSWRAGSGRGCRCHCFGCADPALRLSRLRMGLPSGSPKVYNPRQLVYRLISACSCRMD